MPGALGAKMMGEATKRQMIVVTRGALAIANIDCFGNETNRLTLGNQTRGSVCGGGEVPNCRQTDYGSGDAANQNEQGVRGSKGVPRVARGLGLKPVKCGEDHRCGAFAQTKPPAAFRRCER
jgi:hypothetical protein